MKTVTACTMDCGDACSLLVDTEKRTIRGNPNHPFTKGFCCKKGARYLQRLDSDERVTEPLVRRGDRLEPTDWDTALDLVAARLDAARRAPETILHIHGHGYRGILGQASTNFFERLGASSVYGCLCDDTGIEACLRDFGALNHNDPEDILNSDRVVNWGRDLTRCSVHQLALLKKARQKGVEVLSISPGGDGTPEFSDVNVIIRPGTDRFLAAAVLKLFLEAGDLNPWVLTRTKNWPALRGLVDGLRFTELCAACEVPPADAEMVYEWYADRGNTATLLGWGLQRYLFGGENVRFINAVAMVSGNIGVRGGGAYFNISSGRNLGSWAHLIEGGAKRETPRRLLLQDLGAELRRADPPVEFVWIDGHNVVNQVPDSLAVAGALTAPFTVVVDGFLNDTALCADVILPPALMFEQRDVVGSCLHNYVNLCAPAVPPRGLARPDFDVLADLGARLREPVRFPDEETCLLEGLKRSGVSFDELRENGFARVNHPFVAFENLVFGHLDGLYRFPEALHPEPGRDPDYPLQLLTVVHGDFLHSQIPEAEQRGVPSVWISRANPAFGVLDPESDVYLVTDLGAMEVRVRTVDDLHPRAVLMRRGGWMKYGHGANAIIRPSVTDMAFGMAYYSQSCRLENR
ncbi:molybdopterin-dependent oxidoreductase [Desulfovibrio sp. Huiquan2017]|uniref:molybdopterin-dependent oxidoreductase n=1 Tax=Desulfovibrio sp. Huiquan2017 TaxID=2816861 RepID=UPI001A920D29|nr:molybdopterin-dependent oxidoreductase [Desulfovibrio sp. Huiquan2017]